MEQSRYILQSDPKCEDVGGHPHPGSFWARPYEYHFAMGFVRRGLRMLDAASGGSRYPLQKYMADLSPGFVLAIDQTAWKGDPYPGLEVSQCDMRTIDRPDESCDLITSISVIQHCKPDCIADFFKEAHRLLAYDGDFVITQNVPHEPWRTLAQLQEAGFKCEYDIPQVMEDVVPKDAVLESHPDRRLFRWHAKKENA